MKRKEVAIQPPMFEGVSSRIPTKQQVEAQIGFGVTEDLYLRLLDEIKLGSTLSWTEILAEFRRSDNESDHSWA